MRRRAGSAAGIAAAAAAAAAHAPRAEPACGRPELLPGLKRLRTRRGCTAICGHAVAAGGRQGVERRCRRPAVCRQADWGGCPPRQPPAQPVLLLLAHAAAARLPVGLAGLRHAAARRPGNGARSLEGEELGAVLDGSPRLLRSGRPACCAPRCYCAGFSAQPARTRTTRARVADRQPWLLHTAGQQGFKRFPPRRVRTRRSASQSGVKYTDHILCPLLTGCALCYGFWRPLGRQCAPGWRGGVGRAGCGAGGPPGVV